NLPALREVGFSANRRLLAVQRLSHDPSIGADAIGALTRPTHTPTGTRVPALPIDSTRTQALLAALVIVTSVRHISPTRWIRSTSSAVVTEPSTRDKTCPFMATLRPVACSSAILAALSPGRTAAM